MTTKSYFSNTRQWVLVTVATLCGFVAAYNIGKVPAALSLVRLEFSTSMSWSGALASSYTLVSMCFALGAGLLVSRLGPWRTVAGGLAMLAFGGYLGSEVDSFNALLLSRVVEGIGYVSIAVAMPAFIGRICSDQNRPFAMGVWGTFVPGGVALCMLIAPTVLSTGGWRALWVAGSLVALVCLGLVFFTIRPAVARLADPVVVRAPLRSVFRRTPLVLATCFAIYSATFVGLTTFLPMVWLETQGVAIELATRLAALVVVMNILGNLTGGWAMSRGYALRTVLSVALVGGGLGACVVYIGGMPLPVQVGAAGLSVYLAGMLPASLFASVTDYSDSPSQAGLLLGLLFQGAALGQVCGPVIFGAVVDYFSSWQAAPLFFITLVVGAAMLLRLLPPAAITTVQPNNPMDRL